MKNKLIIDIDGMIVIYYNGVFKTDDIIMSEIKRNAFLQKPVQLFHMMEPVISSLDEGLENVAAAIISVYPERARIIEAPTQIVDMFVPKTGGQ